MYILSKCLKDEYLHKDTISCAVGVVWYYFGLDKAVTQAILIPLISYLLLDRGLPKYLELAIAILGFTTSVIGGITLIVINY